MSEAQSPAQDEMTKAWARDMRNETRIRAVMSACTQLCDEYEGVLPRGTRSDLERVYQQCRNMIDVMVRRWD